MATLTDVFYGHCTFWTDDWELMRRARAERGSLIPCCPYCGSVGYEIDKQKWWAQARAHEANWHPGYVAMLEWGKNQCFPDYPALKAAYEAAARS